MGPLKTKNCKFLTSPIATFCKADDRAYFTGAFIPKSILPNSTGNMSDVYRGKS